MKSLIKLFPFTLIVSLVGGCSSFPWNKVDPGPRITGPHYSEPKPVLSELLASDLKRATDEELLTCEKKSGIQQQIEKLAHPTNFGDRYEVDHWGRSISGSPQLIVLHETVISEPATINLFQTPHPRDEDQVSYHMIVASDGIRIRIVPDHNRAYGSGMSAFGDATQRREPNRVGSVNNISLHLSLVTPADGRGDHASHSGYTQAQYRSLATQVLLWQAKYGIPLTRVTTHAAVDRSHSRYDPRSFRWDYFDNFYLPLSVDCGFERFNNHQAGL